MNLVNDIQDRLTENKSSVKTYKSFDSASKVGQDLGSKFAAAFGYDDAVGFIVVFLPTIARFTVVFQQMAWFSKHQEGGYVGHFANKGFFSI